MTIEEQNVAFPRLMGAPAYARPQVAVELAERPFDPDALPLAVHQTPEERAIADALVPASGRVTSQPRNEIAVAPWSLESPGPGTLAARHFTLRSLTERLRARR